MAMTGKGTKGLLKLQYDVLLKTLRLEKLEHPETYEAAARVAEAVRETAIHFTGTTEDFPELPK